jgi:hypothetical protein
VSDQEYLKDKLKAIASISDNPNLVVDVNQERDRTKSLLESKLALTNSQEK